MANPHLEKNQRYSRSRSLWIVFWAYVVALLVGGCVVYLTQPLGPIYSVLLADIAATFVIWGIGARLSNASLYDPYWSVIPVAIAGYWWSLSGFDVGDSRKLLLMLVLTYWAVRLTGNWVVGWPNLSHEDWRYQDLRAKTGSAYQLVNLFGICLFPTLIVFLGMLPAYIVLAEVHPPNPAFDLIPLVIGLGAVTIQWISDEQMRLFRKQNTDGDVVMKSGLWAWSRHPNYFGEVSMWLSLFLFAFSAAGLSALWSSVGWLAMLGLFLFISIPMMDNRSAAKRPAFKAHMGQSSAFFPWPPQATK